MKIEENILPLPDGKEMLEECISIRRAMTGVLTNAGVRGFADINPYTRHMHLLYYAEGNLSGVSQYIQLWCKAACRLHGTVVDHWTMINVWNDEPLFGGA